MWKGAFSTRQQFCSFTKLKSSPSFPSSLQLFLFFRFLLFLLSLAPSHSIYSRSLQFFLYFWFYFFLHQLFLFFQFTFFSSHLPCPTLFARDPILFSPTGNTILTRSEVQLTMEDRSSHFSRKIHRERLKKMSLFRKVYIWYNSKSMD